MRIVLKTGMVQKTIWVFPNNSYCNVFTPQSVWVDGLRMEFNQIVVSDGGALGNGQIGSGYGGGNLMFKSLYLCKQRHLGVKAVCAPQASRLPSSERSLLHRSSTLPALHHTQSYRECQAETLCPTGNQNQPSSLTSSFCQVFQVKQ